MTLISTDQDKTTIRTMDIEDTLSSILVMHEATEARVKARLHTRDALVVLLFILWWRFMVTIGVDPRLVLRLVVRSTMAPGNYVPHDANHGV
jgi:hypothetical protein